jgi:hypothetical protein
MALKDVWTPQNETMDAIPEIPNMLANAIIQNETDIKELKDGGGSGSTQIMFVEIAENIEADNPHYEFARSFEEIRDWLMNGGYVIGVIGGNGSGNLAFYATQWLIDSVTFTTFVYGITGVTNESMSLNLLDDESVQVLKYTSLNKNYISADNEEFKEAVLNCFPDADTMSFPLEETVSEVNEE